MIFGLALASAICGAIVWYRGIRLPPFLERRGCGCLTTVFAVFSAVLLGELALLVLPLLSNPEPEMVTIASNFFVIAVPSAIAAHFSAKLSKRGEDRHRRGEAVSIYANLRKGKRELYYVYLRPLSLGATKMRNPRYSLLPFFPSFFTQPKLIDFDYYIQECLPRPTIAVGPGFEDLSGWCLHFDDFQWQKAFSLLCDSSLGIVVVPSASKGLLWELSELKRSQYLHKVVFVQPPHIPVATWDSVSTQLKEVGIILATFTEGGTVFSIDSDGNAVDARQLTRRDWSKHQAIGKLLAEQCGVSNAGRGDD